MKELRNILNEFDIDDIGSKCDKLEAYMHGVLDWNEKVNLTAISDKDEFVRKHYIDSLLCANAPEFENSKTVIDVGSGGGFPGVPLAICFPEKKFVLMDSLAKRMRIVGELCNDIGISNVEVIHGRAEELARRKEMRDSFDLCVSRAVANMSTLSEYCLPFVREGGCFIAYKGPECEEEVESASRAIHLLGAELVRIDNAELRAEDGIACKDSDGSFAHKLVYIKKLSSTPKAYPRKPGTPQKKPL